MLHDTLQIVVRRSPSLAVLLVAAHVASLVIVWNVELPNAGQFLLTLLILASLLWSLHEAGWLGRSGFPLILHIAAAERPGGADRWRITDATGRELRGEVIEGSLVLAGLIILRCRVEGSPWWRPARSWLLLPDSVDADAHRRLRVRLRWGRASSV